MVSYKAKNVLSEGKVHTCFRLVSGYIASSMKLQHIFP